MGWPTPYSQEESEGERKEDMISGTNVHHEFGDLLFLKSKKRIIFDPFYVNCIQLVNFSHFNNKNK